MKQKPKLSERTLEELLIAINRATDERGMKIHIKPTYVLVPGVVKMIEDWETKVRLLVEKA